MPTFLVALDGGPEIRIGRAPVLVGRDPQCDARLDSIRVSRRHCALIEVEGTVLVRDLASTNGTRVNGLRVESSRLRPGDELAFAHLRYLVTDVPASAETRVGLVSVPDDKTIASRPGASVQWPPKGPA